MTARYAGSQESLSAAVQGRDDKVGESVGEQDDGDAGEQDACDPVRDHAGPPPWASHRLPRPGETRDLAGLGVRAPEPRNPA